MKLIGVSLLERPDTVRNIKTWNGRTTFRHYFVYLLFLSVGEQNLLLLMLYYQWLKLLSIMFESNSQLPNPQFYKSLCIKSESIYIKSESLCMKSESLCMKSESLCIKSESLCIKSESLCISSEFLCIKSESLRIKSESLSMNVL